MIYKHNTTSLNSVYLATMQTITLITLIGSAMYVMLGCAYVAISPASISLEHWLSILGAFVITIGCFTSVVRH